MTSPLPSLLLVPGSAVPASFYDNFISVIQSLGLSAKAVSHVTVGRRAPGEPLAHMYDDAAAVAAEARKLADEGKHVVLLGHSYGGMVISQCTKGLSVREREAEGKAGGVVRLIYLTAIVPKLGFTGGGSERERIVGDPDFAAEGIPGPYISPDFETAAKKAFNDLAFEEALACAKMGQDMSAAVLLDPLTWAGYKDIPSTYIIAKRDLALPVGDQRAAIEVLKRNAPETSDGKMDVEVLEIDASHGVTVSKPKELAEMLVGVVQRV